MPLVKDLSLPPLPYSLDSLSPVISKKIMDLHYNKHHAGYLNKLKSGLAKTKYENETLENLFNNLDSLPVDIATIVKNNGGGFWNHAFFWQVLSPSFTTPSGKMLDILEKSFKSLSKFKEVFQQKGLSVFGSGWVWLVFNSKKLEIITTPNQINPLMASSLHPIFGVDVWEHAYYLDYYNDRATYLSSLWKIVNWNKIEEFLNAYGGDF